MNIDHPQIKELEYNNITDGIYIGTNQCCQTHFKVCGISREKLIDGIIEGHMSDLAKWVKESEKILIF